MPRSPQEDQTTLKTSRSPSYDQKNNPQNPMEKGLKLKKKKKNLGLKKGKKRRKGECFSRPKRVLGTKKKNLLVEMRNARFTREKQQIVCRSKKKI